MIDDDKRLDISCGKEVVAEAVRRLVPFQSYIRIRQALDLLTVDEES